MDGRKVIGVDIGNSSIKAAEFHASEVGEVQRFDDLTSLVAFFEDAYYVVCTVSKADHRQFLSHEFTLHHTTPLPLKVDYETPQTLGMDRVAAAVGAWTLFPYTDILVIDSGTCITYDLVTADGTFRGGIISPGLDMRYRAMHEFTSGLPRLYTGGEPPAQLVGKSTESCMRIGAEQGLKLEIQAHLESFNKKYDRLQVVLTGGWQPGFESNIKASIFAGSKIVLGGLHAIWKFNEGY